MRNFLTDIFSRQRSIRKKIMVLTVGVSLMALFFTCLSYIIYDRISFKEKMIRDLATLSKLIGENTQAALVFFDQANAAKTLETLKAENHIVAASVFNRYGDRFASYQRKGDPRAFLPKKPERDGHYFRNDSLMVFQSIILDGDQVGTIHLQSDLEELTSRMLRFSLILALLMGIAVFGVYVISSSLQKVISEPILNLSEVARKISDKKDYSVRAVKQGEDEIGFMTDRFNEMVSQVEERDQALMKAQDELEGRVNERTSELGAANRDLVNEIAERKRTAEELSRSKEAAEAANRAKSEFLANMSHELRTPLNHIIGFNELVLSKEFGALNETQEEFLNDVLGSSRHLLSLINDVLDLSKVEAGRMELDLASFALKSLLDNSLTMVKEKSHNHGIRLHTEFQDLPDTLVADERKIKQVLYNLLSNAVKFTPNGGSVKLTVHPLNGSALGTAPLLQEKNGAPPFKTDAPYLEFIVSDTGIGLKTEDLARIFNPFEQADNSASRKYQGTGLGLALAKQMVELHGGRIWAESPGEGAGAGFHFILPVREERPGGYAEVRSKELQGTAPYEDEVGKVLAEGEI
jgi:signal transduction histidine kinase